MIKRFVKAEYAISWSLERLANLGGIVDTRHWHGQSFPRPTLELLNHSFTFDIDNNPENWNSAIKPNQPWAFEHFKERICGLPLNPPPSHILWPHSKQDNESHLRSKLFDHSYPERYFPKQAGDIQLRSDSNKNKPHIGIRYAYGDLNDLINLIHKDPNTRQGILPVWFPEDTGNVFDGRVPCTIGYQLIQRFGYFHIVYFIRSCDAIRHFRDDIYLTLMLLKWVHSKLLLLDFDFWEKIKLGTMTMHITSLHCFSTERSMLM